MLLNFSFHLYYLVDCDVHLDLSYDIFSKTLFHRHHIISTLARTIMEIEEVEKKRRDRFTVNYFLISEMGVLSQNMGEKWLPP